MILYKGCRTSIKVTKAWAEIVYSHFSLHFLIILYYSGIGRKYFKNRIKTTVRQNVLAFLAHCRIFRFRNIRRQDHIKIIRYKLTILENSVGAMQKQIQKCTLKEVITSKLQHCPYTVCYNHVFELQKDFLFWSQRL